MQKSYLILCYIRFFLITAFILFALNSTTLAEDIDKSRSAPPVPVRVAVVEKKLVSNQISLTGTAEAITKSDVASEVSGIVEYYPIREGDFVKKGDLLARLRSTNLRLGLKGAIAAREEIKANLANTEKELVRISRLRDKDSIAERNYDEVFYNHRALLQRVIGKGAEIELLEYEIMQKDVVAPFSGFISREHTQVGEWISAGGLVATIIDLNKIRITVDVPERYAAIFYPEGEVTVLIKSISNNPLAGRIYAVLPQGNPNARTFPVRINLANPGFKIKSGMEAMVAFSLADTKNALLIPKDAVVTAGSKRLVYHVMDGKALSVDVNILGYYGNNVEVEGNLQSGCKVVVRGNERLRPGQSVVIIE